MILGTQPRWLRPGIILVAMLVFMLIFRQRTAPLRLASPQAFEFVCPDRHNAASWFNAPVPALDGHALD